MAVYSEQFGVEVRALLKDRPYRSLARLAGISASYVSDMVQGRIPRREVVVAFARATEADAESVNRLLSLAGYAALSEIERLSSDALTRPAALATKALAAPEPGGVGEASLARVIAETARQTGEEVQRALTAERLWQRSGAEVLLSGLRRLVSTYGRTPDLADLPVQPAPAEAHAYLTRKEQELAGSTRAPSLPALGRHESPFDRMDRLFQEKSAYYRAQGYTVPSWAGSAESGVAEFTDADVDAAIASWEGRIRRLNPGRPFDLDQPNSPR